MDLIIKNARLFDPVNGLDDVGDILVRNGSIASVGGRMDPPAGCRVVDGTGKLLLPGLFDMHVHLREPGFEYKEDIESGSKAAVAGGFVSIACMPNTKPVNDSRSVTEFIQHRAAEVGLCRVYPIAAMTKGREGASLAPMAELSEVGVRAVSDDGDAVADAGLMRRVLEYADTFGMVAIQHCEDKNLSRSAPMNEGVSSAKAGLAGQPAAAETTILARDLYLCKLTGARYHAAHISTAESVELIRRAKAEGLAVTAEVTIHHLTFTDDVCLSYDTNTKVNPPFRRPEDVVALRAGLEDGTIDAVVTDHAPHTSIEKELEYDYASFGILGLETALPLGLELVRKGLVRLERLVEAWTIGPASVLGLDWKGLVEGAQADMVLVDEAMEWTVEPSNLQSKSSNTPLLGKKVQGRAVLTLVGGNVVWDLVRESLNG